MQPRVMRGMTVDEQARMGSVTLDYEKLTGDLVASVRLGYEVEADDPNIAFHMPTDDEIRWLAGWLVSEGWTRPSNWLHD